MEILLERVKELCKSRSITVATLEDELNFSPNTIYQWKQRIPGTKKLNEVADYFGVSIDYLLGRTDNPYSGLSDEQRQLTVEEAIDSVMSHDGKPLTDNDREVLKRIAEAYLDGKL